MTTDPWHTTQPSWHLPSRFNPTEYGSGPKGGQFAKRGDGRLPTGLTSADIIARGRQFDAVLRDHPDTLRAKTKAKNAGEVRSNAWAAWTEAATDALVAQRAEALSAIHRSESEARKRLATVRGGVLADALAKVRAVGQSATVKATPGAEDCAAVLRTQVLRLPADWVRAVNVADVVVDSGARDAWNPSRSVITLTRSGAAMHEYGHAVETHVPEVRAAVHRYFKERVAGQTFGQVSFEEGAVGYPSAFPTNPYLGRLHKVPGTKDDLRATELLAMGLEDAFAGRDGFWADADAEFRHFILGVLVTL